MRYAITRQIALKMIQKFKILFAVIISFFALHFTSINSCIASVLHIDSSGVSTLAFPGASGGGKYTTGGRGGKVIKVTNLNDSGPGSFRDAIKKKGARTIVFDVSGTINLNSPIHINNNDLTIAGQTAPGDGICIQGHEVRISANNIIIRFLRFRPGDIANVEHDALTGMRNSNIIIDHCSMSWSTDETVSLYDNENFTLQWSIISESLNNSVHSKGAHGYGGIWGGKNASFIFNVMAHHNSRNPRLQGTRYQNEEGQEKAEIINNVIYNWGDKAIYGGENGSYNIINNIFIPGPASPKSKTTEIFEPYKPYGLLYLKGNEIWKASIDETGWENIKIDKNKQKKHLTKKPYPLANSTSPLCTQLAYNQILSTAGASLSRDEVDKRIIKEVSERTYTYGNAGIIDSQSEVGGWPQLNSLPPQTDSDGDGIPDEWEQKNGLDPSNLSDGNNFSIDPLYTNLEVYINSLVDNIMQYKN
jgi:hypothetical protein